MNNVASVKKYILLRRNYLSFNLADLKVIIWNSKSVFAFQYVGSWLLNVENVIANVLEILFQQNPFVWTYLKS